MPKSTWNMVVDELCRPERDSHYEPHHLLGGDSGEFQAGSISGFRQDLKLANRDGLLLHCSHFQPEFPVNSDRCHPCVVYTHSATGSRREAEEAVRLLVSLGISVFAFDFAGSGVSEGQWVTLGAGEAGDLDCVLEHLEADKKLSKVGVWGCEMGAAAALMSRRLKGGVAALVLDSPHSTLQGLVADAAQRSAGVCLQQPQLEQLEARLRDALLQRAGAEAAEACPMECARTCTIPAMFGVGAHPTDPASPSSPPPTHPTHELHTVYPGDKSIVFFHPSQNPPRSPFFTHMAASFFLHHLAPSAPPSTPPPQLEGLATRLVSKLLSSPTNDPATLYSASLSPSPLSTQTSSPHATPTASQTPYSTTPVKPRLTPIPTLSLPARRPPPALLPQPSTSPPATPVLSPHHSEFPPSSSDTPPSPSAHSSDNYPPTSPLYHNIYFSPRTLRSSTSPSPTSTISTTHLCTPQATPLPADPIPQPTTLAAHPLLLTHSPRTSPPSPSLNSSYSHSDSDLDSGLYSPSPSSTHHHSPTSPTPLQTDPTPHTSSPTHHPCLPRSQSDPTGTPAATWTIISSFATAQGTITCEAVGPTPQRKFRYRLLSRDLPPSPSCPPLKESSSLAGLLNKLRPPSDCDSDCEDAPHPPPRPVLPKPTAASWPKFRIDTGSSGASTCDSASDSSSYQPNPERSHTGTEANGPPPSTTPQSSAPTTPDHLSTKPAQAPSTPDPSPNTLTRPTISSTTTRASTTSSTATSSRPTSNIWSPRSRPTLLSAPSGTLSHPALDTINCPPLSSSPSQSFLSAAAAFATPTLSPHSIPSSLYSPRSTASPSSDPHPKHPSALQPHPPTTSQRGSSSTVPPTTPQPSPRRPFTFLLPSPRGVKTAVPQPSRPPAPSKQQPLHITSSCSTSRQTPLLSPRSISGGLTTMVKKMASANKVPPTNSPREPPPAGKKTSRGHGWACGTGCLSNGTY